MNWKDVLLSIINDATSRKWLSAIGFVGVLLYLAYTNCRIPIELVVAGTVVIVTYIIVEGVLDRRSRQ